MFSYVDVGIKSSARITEYFGISAEDCPQARFFSLTDPPKKYKYDSKEVNDKQWGEFVEEVLSGKREPFMKSEEPIEYSGKGVRSLVAKEHDAFVANPALNIFVEYYAPWCGHCKTLEPKWTQLGEFFEGVSNVVIAKMDASQNEVASVAMQGFPTLYIYPATQDGTGKKGPGIQYLGERSYEDLQLFVERHGVNIPKETFHKADPAHDHPHDHKHDEL